MILYFHVRERSYLFYAIHLLSNAGYAIFCWIRVDEDLQSAYPITSNNFYLIALCTTLGMIAYMYFLRSFLSLKKNLPFWDKLFKYYGHLGWLVVLLALAIFMFHPEPVRPFLVTAILYVLVSTLIGILFIPPLFRLRKKTNYYFIFGFCSLTIFAIISVISRILGMEYFFVYIELGVLSEVILFSIGLTYQTQQREKKSRQTLVELEMSKSRRKVAQMEADRQAEMSELRKDFYTNLTHEFRTPLTVINGMAEEVANSEGSKEVAVMGEMIGRNSMSLLHIVNQMLDIEKQSHDTSELHYIVGDIISYLKYILASFQSLAQSKSIDLRFESEVESLEMAYDEFRVQQIMYNLISNAIKYSDAGSSILVIVKVLDGDVLNIKVIDNGFGINLSEQERIFEKYYQIRKNVEQDLPSSGIGLYFTKKLVEKLGGQISIESQLGEGSTFAVDFPILKEIPVKELSQMSPKQGNTYLEVSAENIHGEKPLLLIAEDNYDVASYLAYCLKEHYELMISYNGTEAAQMAIDHLPDIIISDVMMPDKTGFELCEELKSHRTTSHIPIILLSGRSDYDSRMEGIEKGADAYLAKPFKKGELLLRLRKLFESRALLQEKYRTNHLLEDDQSRESVVEDPFLESIRDLILENIEEPGLQITDLTAKLYVSHTQLYRKVKALTNLTPTQFIRQVRLSEAVDLLKKKDKTISEIAYATGFSDPNYFSRIFKKEFNSSPGDYREKNIQEQAV